MAKSRMLSGTPILQADNTIPGIKIHKEVREVLPDIEAACHKMGLDYYPVIVEFVSYDEMAELASYGGFPVRYPHWRFGMEYEEMARGYEHNQYRISEMVINCLAPSTRILTRRGTLPASSVKVGDLVVVGNDTRKVVAVVNQPKSKTKNIKLRGYLKEITCTPLHKWAVLTTSGLVWKEASELQSGDLLVGCDSYSGFQGYAVGMNCDISERGRKDIELPVEMIVELAELMGAIIGDGSCGVKGNENDVYVTVGNDQVAYQERIAGLFSKCFGVEPSFQRKSRAVEVMLQSKTAVSYFDANGIPAGCTYKTKRVPKIIWQASHEYRAAFLRGLFDTDGFASDVLGMSAYNPDLIADVQTMLLEMGITSFAETIPNGFSNDMERLFITTLDIRGKASIERFKERIGFSIAYKQEGLERLLETEFCRGGGVQVPYLQDQIVKWSEKNGLNTYNSPSLGRSAKMMRRERVGLNCLYSFVERAMLNPAYVFPNDLVELSRRPIMEVESVKEGPESVTVDIALDHDAHDFIAEGVLSHNTNPCYIFCMDSNTLVDNVDVIAHAIGHNDFFKNNIFFEPTDDNMMNKLANHGTRIRNYMARWGHEVVTEFIDQILRIETLIDPSKAWRKKKIKDVNVKDERHYEFAERLVSKHNYMDEWVNPKAFIQKQQEEIKKKEAAEFIDLFEGSVRDIFGFLKDNAPLKPWQQDIISMLYEEALYFSPQRATKMANEGWASYVDYHIMCREGLAALGQPGEDCGIWHYAEHKMRVLGGKYSQNPYKLGFELLLDIEDRWNKGKFGAEWENCTNMREKELWNKKLGLGKEKVFEVRKHYNDFTMISEFFTPEFCEKKQFFEWKHFPNGEYKIVDRDFKSIKRKLLQRYLNGGLPDIRLTDPNHLGKGWFFMQHLWDGRPLYDQFARETIISLFRLWKNVVVLSTRNRDGVEYMYICNGANPEKDVHVMPREEYEKEFLNK